MRACLFSFFFLGLQQLHRAVDEFRQRFAFELTGSQECDVDELFQAFVFALEFIDGLDDGLFLAVFLDLFVDLFGSLFTDQLLDERVGCVEDEIVAIRHLAVERHSLLVG